MIRILFTFGTRPEAIKLLPVIREMLHRNGVFHVAVCLTSQHKQLLRQVTDLFGIREDYDLDVMTYDQSLDYVTSTVLTRMGDVITRERPDVLLIQGDTTTVFASALAAFYQKVKVGHVEAGLRTYDKYSPFPEEMNRRIATALADFHFTPTRRATDNLLRENVNPASIIETGNTIVDALELCREMLDRLPGEKRRDLLESAGISPELTHRILSGSLQLILVTAHRRESFGAPFERMCQAMRDIVELHPEAVIVYPVHPNPNVRDTVSRVIGNHERIVLIEPVRYEQLVELMIRSRLLLTDSGGIQEEGPSVSKPVLVMREVTERPEGIEAGVSLLVGTDRDTIVSAVHTLMKDDISYRSMIEKPNPYGDGKAAVRIADFLGDVFGSRNEQRTEPRI